MMEIPFLTKIMKHEMMGVYLKTFYGKLLKCQMIKYETLGGSSV